MNEESLRENIAAVRERIEAAARQSGRAPDAVKLVAVTKTWPAEVVRAAYGAGLVCFGENYVQEALPKQEQVADLALQWHFIGHLQRNKVRQIAGRFDLIHSVDRLDLGREVSTRATMLGQIQKILIEVNFAGEASKSGAAPKDVPALLEDLQHLEFLRLHGLMVMPPLEMDASALGTLYSEVQKCHQAWRSQMDTGAHPFDELSMGTSHDYELAIANGATMVRLGSVLFGERTKG